MPARAALVVCSAAAAAAQYAGRYATSMGWVADLPDLLGDAPHSASIYYPTGGAKGETFPVVVFMHGGGIGSTFPPVNASYPWQLHTYASFGFVVVAPESCPGVNCNAACGGVPATQECAVGWGLEALNAVVGAKFNTGVHPALAAADFTRVGIAGHSMGGMAAVAAATRAALTPGYNIRAVVAQHPNLVPEPNVSVPTLFTAGTADATGATAIAEQMFGDDRVAPPKALYIIDGAEHTEMCGGAPPTAGPPYTNREDAVAAQFLACHVRGEGCGAVYGGSGDALCTHAWPGKQHTSLSACEVRK